MSEKRKLNAWEKKELERIEELKNAYIYEMMGKVEHLNEEKKRIKSGTWWQQHELMYKQISKEVNSDE